MDVDVDVTQALFRGLAGYVRAVAQELDLPAEGTSFEISDTATAYIGLAARWPARPGRDLMLNWSECAGWSIAVETTPAELTLVVAEFGADPLPPPRPLARFVTNTLAGHRRRVALDRARPDPINRHMLAARLARYISD
ncbi:MAG TPA: DUF6292 family protein [Amycolatopsis sp.]|uniref:DUF6292 family protein n=1 Tax=Amycolatopsis sp. TaxID=37632 RepID=UPI002B490F47|nr:DUF6292 family protein [Amycolatopsis sp.]HKS44579.1 DUF6292 family protein [Amycolatopsis sp.]